MLGLRYRNSHPEISMLQMATTLLKRPPYNINLALNTPKNSPVSSQDIIKLHWKVSELNVKFWFGRILFWRVLLVPRDDFVKDLPHQIGGLEAVAQF